MPQAEVTYRAVHAVSPGKLELTRKPLLDPPPGYVRMRVEACGVCHTDATTVEGVFPIAWPRVPGHEAVGIIDKLGAGVEHALDPGNASALHGDAPQRPGGDGWCRHASPLPLSSDNRNVTRINEREASTGRGGDSTRPVLCDCPLVRRTKP